MYRPPLHRGAAPVGACGCHLTPPPPPPAAPHTHLHPRHMQLPVPCCPSSARRGPSPQQATCPKPRVLTRRGLSAWPGTRQAGVCRLTAAPPQLTHTVRHPAGVRGGQGCRGGVPPPRGKATSANRSELGKVRPSWAQEHSTAAGRLSNTPVAGAPTHTDVQGCQGMPGRVGDRVCVRRAWG